MFRFTIRDLLWLMVVWFSRYDKVALEDMVDKADEVARRRRELNRLEQQATSNES
jgi:hypothetical protein